MKQLKKLKTLASGLTLSVVMLASSAASVYAMPTTSATPPAANKEPVSGPQAKVPFEPGTQDAKATEKLGSTNEIKIEADGTPKAFSKATPLAGNVSGVDFQTPLNYCSNSLTYTPVKNTTATAKSLRIMVWNQGMYRDLYTSVASGATINPAFYGVKGAYSAYLYVWNGTSYVYDEYKSSSNTCNVSVTRTYNTGGWVQLKIQNLGTAYATQRSTELAPYPAAGTYTGTHYDYPVAGGAAIYRWFQVGTQPYGIISQTVGSSNSTYFFTGDL